MVAGMCLFRAHDPELTRAPYGDASGVDGRSHDSPRDLREVAVDNELDMTCDSGVETARPNGRPRADAVTAR